MKRKKERPEVEHRDDWKGVAEHRDGIGGRAPDHLMSYELLTTHYSQLTSHNYFSRQGASRGRASGRLERGGRASGRLERVAEHRDSFDADTACSMVRNYLLIFILLICFTKVLSAGAIYEELQYHKTDENVWNLRSSAFRVDLKDNLNLELSKSRFVIFFRFTLTADPDYISLRVNNISYHDVGENLHALGSGYIIDIIDYLKPGKNKISLSYDEPAKRDKRDWSFYVTSQPLFNLSSPHPITQARGEKRNMAVSPDGRLVAYILSHMEETSIEVINLDNNEEHTVIKSRAERIARPDQEEKFYSYAPCWSSDGRYLFFISNKGGFPQIYRVYVDYEGVADENTLVQLTDSQVYITNLLYSHQSERLYFSKMREGFLRLYKVDNPIAKESSDDFSNAQQLITQENRHELTPDVSHDGKYLAFSYEELGTDTRIEILDKENYSLIETVIIPDRDALYPSWSPQENVLAFFSDDKIYIYNMETRTGPVPVAADRRPSTYIQKPVWDLDGEHIHFIKNDRNYSLNRIRIDTQEERSVETIAYLDSQSHRDNRELLITPNMKNILYVSTQGGNYNIWSMKRKGISDESLTAFETSFNTELSWINPRQRKRESLGFAPLLEHPQAAYEMENIKVGPQRFFLDDEPQLINTRQDKPAVLRFTKRPEPNLNVSSMATSTLMPGWGQRRNDHQRKSKLFFRSFLGLAAVGAAAYFFEDQAHSDYDAAANIRDIDKHRTEAVRFRSYKNSIIVSGSLLYLLNIFDAAVSNPQTGSFRRQAYDEAYARRRTQSRRYRPIYGKELTGLSELKIITNRPETSIYLKDEYGSESYYGKSNYDFNENIHFTVTDLEPGNYTLVGRHKDYHTIRNNINLEPYLVKYSTLEFQREDRKVFDNLLNKTVPSYYHFNNNQRTKGAAILGLSTLALGGALITHLQANNQHRNYNDFNDPHNVAQLREYKDSYHRNISYRNSFLGLFLLTYLYNLYDTKQ